MKQPLPYQWVKLTDGTEYLKELRYSDGDSSIQIPKI